MTKKKRQFNEERIVFSPNGAGKGRHSHAKNELNVDIILFSSLAAQRIKHLPTMQETQVRSLGWEDPLEKEMATNSSNLAWEIPWTEEPGGPQFMGQLKSQTQLSQLILFTKLTQNVSLP